MPTIAELMVEVGADIKRLERGMAKARREVQDVGRSMERVGTRLTATLTAPLTAVGGIALKTSADFESLRQSMNILNGSVEEGARNFERLKQFSATTPFQLNDLAQAQNMLQGFGLEADEAFQSLSMIGDIAAVAEGDIKGIGIAFGQAAAEGRLMTRDIRQLINQGVPAIKLLADTMNVAQSEVLDLASQGEISFEVLQQAFKDATSEGGLFANGMQKQSQTLGGVFSTMKDNINIALASIGDTMSSLAKGVMQQVISMSQAFSELNESTKQMIVTAGLLVAAIGPAIFIIGKLTVVIGALISPIGLAVAAIAGLIVIGKNMVDNWDVISADLNAIWQGIKKVAWIVVGGIMDAFTWMASGILSTLSNMASVMDQSLANALTLARAKVEEANEGIQQSVEESKKRFTEAGEAAEEARKDMVSLGDSFWSIMDAIKGGIGSGLSWLSNTIFPETKKAADKLTTSIKSINIEVAKATKTMGLFGDVFAFAKSNMEGGLFSPAGMQNLKRAESQYDSIREAMGEMTDKAKVMGQALQSSVTAAVTGFAETLGNAFTGDAGASGFFNNILLVVVDFANKFGKLLVAAGVAALAFKKLLANPAAAIIAGTALIAATTAIKNLLQKGPEAPALANGGLAFGPTLAVVGDNRGARSNPEVIAPLDKLQGMMEGGSRELHARIKGSDIFLSSERGKNIFR